MSPTRRSFVKAATASLAAAAFTWPEPSRAANAPVAPIEAPMQLIALTPDGRSYGNIVLYPDGSVEVENFEHRTVQTFDGDTLIAPGVFLRQAMETLRVVGGDA